MTWDRLFQKPSLSKSVKIPDLTTDQAADFRLQTEERVSREKHVEREAVLRNDADIALREEMHSFGMIRCEYFDPETKLIELSFVKSQAFSVPARSFPHANYTDKVWASSAVTVNEKIEPPYLFGSNDIVPFIAVTSVRQIARPSPEPPYFREIDASP